MQTQPASKLLCSFLTFSSLLHHAVSLSLSLSQIPTYTINKLSVIFSSFQANQMLKQIAGLGANCAANSPTVQVVQQTQVGFGEHPKFMLEVQNKCPMCPVINIHLNCRNFTIYLNINNSLQVLIKCPYRESDKRGFHSHPQ